MQRSKAYRTAVFLQGDEADAYLEQLRTESPREVLRCLDELTDERSMAESTSLHVKAPYGVSDMVYRLKVGTYVKVLTWNSGYRYVTLTYEYNALPEGSETSTLSPPAGR